MVPWTKIQNWYAAALFLGAVASVWGGVTWLLADLVLSGQ